MIDEEYYDNVAQSVKIVKEIMKDKSVSDVRMEDKYVTLVIGRGGFDVSVPRQIGFASDVDEDEDMEEYEDEDGEEDEDEYVVYEPTCKSRKAGF